MGKLEDNRIDLAYAIEMVQQIDLQQFADNRLLGLAVKDLALVSACYSSKILAELCDRCRLLAPMPEAHDGRWPLHGNPLYTLSEADFGVILANAHVPCDDGLAKPLSRSLLRNHPAPKFLLKHFEYRGVSVRAVANKVWPQDIKYLHQFVAAERELTSDDLTDSLRDLLSREPDLQGASALPVFEKRHPAFYRYLYDHKIAHVVFAAVGWQRKARAGSRNYPPPAIRAASQIREAILNGVIFGVGSDLSGPLASLASEIGRELVLYACFLAGIGPLGIAYDPVSDDELIDALAKSDSESVRTMLAVIGVRSLGDIRQKFPGLEWPLLSTGHVQNLAEELNYGTVDWLQVQMDHQLLDNELEYIKNLVANPRATDKSIAKILGMAPVSICLLSRRENVIRALSILLKEEGTPPELKRRPGRPKKKVPRPPVTDSPP